MRSAPLASTRQRTYIGPGLVMIGLFVAYLATTPGAASVGYMTTLVNDSGAVAIAAIGEAIVVVLGGFDLSVGALMSVVNVTLATHFAVAGSSSTTVAVVVAIGIGLAGGVVNGLAVAVGRVPSVIVTIGTNFIFSGIALIIEPTAGGQVAPAFAEAFTGSVGDVPKSLILIALIALLWTYVRRTRLGTAIYALGSDQEAAFLNAVRGIPVRVAAFGMAGVCYALAGVFLTAQTGSGDPTIGLDLTLSVFAATVVGGIRLGGGKGHVPAAIIGAFVLSLIGDVLFSFGISSFYTDIYSGGALIAAVVLSSGVGGIRSIRQLFRARPAPARVEAGV